MSDIPSPTGRAFIISLQKQMLAVIITRGTQRNGRPFHRHRNHSFRNFIEFSISPQCSPHDTRLRRTGIILSLMHANSLSAIISFTMKPRVVWRSTVVLTCFNIVALVRSCTRTTVRKWILRDLVCKKKLLLTAKKLAVRMTSKCLARIYEGKTVLIVFGICCGLTRVPFPLSTSTTGPWIVVALWKSSTSRSL